jgi:hypothetical protein
LERSIYNKPASMIMAMADAECGSWASTTETISRINRTTHTVDLMTFVMRKANGFNLRRAKRMISVIVRMRQKHNIAIQIGIILL